MPIEITIPTVGESITEVTLSKWLVNDSDYVEMDQEICEIESDKATFELPAEKAGQVKLLAEEGQDLNIGDVVCTIDTEVEAPASKPSDDKPAPEKETEKPVQRPVDQAATYATGHPSPAAAKLMAENNITADQLAGSGRDGRITKADVLAHLSGDNGRQVTGPRVERREKLSRLRRTIAAHLVASKNQTAMLTTFNEVNMDPVMNLRKRYKEEFQEVHGVKLGFMSFFITAVCTSLKEFPAVNANIDGNDILYHDYCDISIAVSTPRGLVVPVIRDAQKKSFAELEFAVNDLATRGRDNELKLEEMEGGTFTVSNGGVFGSLMSTPIINAPQSAILGMHKIEPRPVVEDGKVVIHNMMYLAVSYDHRIIDGRESVSFLVRIKELLENPAELMASQKPEEVLFAK